jgi:hypothetical protein
VIIVSGTRHATLEDHIEEIDVNLYRFCRWWAPTARSFLLVEGEAPGVDSLCRRIAETWRKDWGIDPVPARWSECGPGCPPTPHRRQNGTNCPYAGPRRNLEMLQRHPGAPVLAMPSVGGKGAVPDQSRGTWNMIYQTAGLKRPLMILPLVLKPTPPPQPVQGLW